MLAGLGATEAPSPVPPSVTGSPEMPATDTHEAITFPFGGKPLNLNFKTMGLVREVHVKPGDRVKKGQELAILEDRQEQIERDIYKLEADSQVAIKVAEESMRVKELEKARYERMFRDKVATDLEFEKVQAEAKVAFWELEKAKMELEQKKLQLKRQEALLDNMRIRSTVDGVVQEIAVHPGEVSDPQKTAIIVVGNSPLWVKTILPAKVALRMRAEEKKTGQAQIVQVTYKDLNEPPLQAKVIFYAPMADGGAGVQEVGLELPNPDDKPAGLQVLVKVPEAGKGAAVSAKSE